MTLFPCGHAAHPQWRMACGLVLAQLRAQMALPDYAGAPTLGLLYITDHYAGAARDILDHLQAELPEVGDWAGTVGVGVCASNAEYIDEPALSVLLCELPVDQYRVFSGVAPLSGGPDFTPHTALIHADAQTPELAELIAEMAQRTATGYLFGGLASSRSQVLQFAASGHGNAPGQGAAGGVFSGGLSGVAFGDGVALISRVTQGCQPVASEREITQAEGNVLLELDGEPALDVMLRDLDVSLEEPRAALDVVRRTLVGLSSPGERRAPHRQLRRRRARAPHHRRRSGPARHRHRRAPAGRPARRLLPARCARRARRPDAHLRRDPRRAGTRGSARSHRRRVGCVTRGILTPSRAAHSWRHLHQLRRSWRPALRRPQCGTADRAPRAG